MNEPVKFPVYIVMRNGHIMPPGIHMHRVNAEATAVKEEGEVVELYRSPVESVPVAVLEKLVEEWRETASRTDADKRYAGHLRKCADRLSAIVKENSK